MGKHKNKKDKIDIEKLLQNENYKIGTFERKEKGFGFVNISKDEEDIYISPKLTKHAMNEDKVLIKIFEDCNYKKGKKD